MHFRASSPRLASPSRIGAGHCRYLNHRGHQVLMRNRFNLWTLPVARSTGCESARCFVSFSSVFTQRWWARFSSRNLGNRPAMRLEQKKLKMPDISAADLRSAKSETGRRPKFRSERLCLRQFKAASKQFLSPSSKVRIMEQALLVTSFAQKPSLQISSQGSAKLVMVPRRFWQR